MKKVKKIQLLVLVLTVLSLAVFLSGCSSKPETNSQQVQTAPPQPGVTVIPAEDPATNEVQP
jgi:PBP1b-binding outer membrane lipoprotein LpoB